MPAAHRLLAALTVMLLVTACGASDRDREPTPVEATPLGDMVGTMDKARAVENTTMQHKEDLDRAIESQENAR